MIQCLIKLLIQPSGDAPVEREAWVAPAATASYIVSDPTAAVAPVAVAVPKPYPVASLSTVPPTARDPAPITEPIDPGDPVPDPVLYQEPDPAYPLPSRTAAETVAYAEFLVPGPSIEAPIIALVSAPPANIEKRGRACSLPSRRPSSIVHREYK